MREKIEKDGNDSTLLSRVVYPLDTAVALTAGSAGNSTSGSSGGGCETWAADLGANNNMMPSAEELRSYQPVSVGTSVEIVDGKSLPVAECGLLKMKEEQRERPTRITLGRVLHEPNLGRNLISKRRLALMSGQPFSKSPWRAHVGVGEGACCFFDFNEASGLYEMKAKWSAMTAERAVLESTPIQLHIMEAHRLVAQPSE